MKHSPRRGPSRKGGRMARKSGRTSRVFHSSGKHL